MEHEEDVDGGLAVKVETENWQTHTRVTAAPLRELVLRIGGAGDRFLVVQRIPDRPHVFAQVWHEEGGTSGGATGWNTGAARRSSSARTSRTRAGSRTC